MSLTLYDVSVPNYLQGLSAADAFMRKGRDFCSKAGLGDAIEGLRLAPDMQPFRFQIVSVIHHSLGAIEGVLSGSFAPPPMNSSEDFDTLAANVTRAKAMLGDISADAINSRAGSRVNFEIGGRIIPFTASNFLLSFSLPNFYFHTATAYDLLRAQGAPLGKRDYLGALRTGL